LTQTFFFQIQVGRALQSVLLVIAGQFTAAWIVVLTRKGL